MCYHHNFDVSVYFFPTRTYIAIPQITPIIIDIIWEKSSPMSVQERGGTFSADKPLSNMPKEFQSEEQPKTQLIETFAKRRLPT